MKWGCLKAGTYGSYEHALTLGSLGTEVALHIAPRRRDAFWRSLSRRGADDPAVWEP